ncbi:MAG: MFS family permease [Candidatus Azotimanducaceae bacterium]|jgi:MFS family permease
MLAVLDLEASPLTSAPPKHFRWYVVALTLVNQALSVGIVVYSFSLFVVPWLSQFGIGRGTVMGAIFGFQLVVGCLSPVFGRLMDQYSMRWLVLTGAFLLASGLCLISFATAFWQIVLIHATLLPIGMILSGTLASQTMVSKWFVEQRSLAIGLSSMGTSMGGFVFPLVTSGLIASYDWQGAALFLGLLVAIVMLPLNLAVLRYDPPVRQIDGSASPTLDSKVWTTKEILETRNFWIPVLCLVPINAAFGGVQFNLGAYISDLGMTQQFAAQLIAVTSLTMIGGKFVFGMLGDRVDHRKLYWLMVATLLVALQFYRGSPGQPELIVAAMLQGFATGGVMPMMGIMYASRFGTFSFGRVLGLVNMFLMIGSLGSIFSGWVFDKTQSYDAAFWIFSAALIPCIFAMIMLPAPVRSNPQPAA